MNDITRAMLGDKEAQERVTERGGLLPCGWCGKTPQEDDLIFMHGEYRIYHDCKRAGAMRTRGKTRKGVCLAWNTRPALLTPEQIKRLEEMEDE